MKNLVARGRANLVLVIVLSICLIAASYYSLSQAATVKNATERSTALEDRNSKLEAELADTKKELKVYEGISKLDLQEMCSQKAKTNYSDYMRSNSAVVKEGNTTYITPKSPDVNREANQRLEADEKACREKFS